MKHTRLVSGYRLLLAAMCLTGGWPAQAEKFKVASWNLGHFSLGVSAESSISREKAPERVAEYRALIDAVNADLFGSCEYAAFVDREKTIATRQALFGGYPIAFEGPEGRGGHVESLFVKNGKASSSTLTYFTQRYQNTGFHMTEVEIAGVKALFVVLHLEPDWPTDQKEMRRAQILQLLDTVGDRPYVIIDGDWDVFNKDLQKLFLERGFRLANDGSRLTWHTSRLQYGVDTVVVRGFDISDVEVHPVGSMSDHLLICCTLDPILGAPEWIDRTDRYAPYLGPEQRVVWKNRRLADITSVEGYADGAWLIGRTRAPGVITKRDATSMTVQFQALSGQCKAVRAHFRQQGADIVGRTDKAGYGDAALYGKPLPEDAFKYEVAQAATNGTYGVYDLAAFGSADKRTEAQAMTGSFRVATWNIGHFSGGVSAVSSITKAMAPQRIADYRALLEEVNADLFGVCEYSPMLDKEQTIAVRSALFGDYPIAFEGPTGKGGHVNSLFLRNGTCERAVVTPYAERYQNTNFHMAEVRIAGVKAVFVMTHLEPNWPTNHREMRRAQIKQLLDAVADCPYVILNADWNTVDQTELKPFVDAGFQLANDGTLMTWHTSDPKVAIDNIITRGFVQKDPKVHAVGSLSDHMLLSCTLEPIPLK